MTLVGTMLSMTLALSAAGEPVTTTGDSGYALVRVPGGTYTRGCTPGQGDLCHKSERPAHSVTVGHDLWVGRTEVTQGLYVSVMGSSPHQFEGCGDTCPAETLSWFDAVPLLVLMWNVPFSWVHDDGLPSFAVSEQRFSYASASVSATLPIFVCFCSLLMPGFFVLCCILKGASIS